MNSKFLESEKKISELMIEISNLDSEKHELLKEIKILRDEVENAFVAGQNTKELASLKIQFEIISQEKEKINVELSNLKTEFSQNLSKLNFQNKELTEYRIKWEKYEKMINQFSKMSASTISQEDYDKLKEQLNNKISEVISLEASLQIIKDSNKNTETLINLQKEEIIALKNTLREFTTFKYDEYDETYEAVLKAEFDRMKAAYEKRINTMQNEMEQLRKESFSQISEKTKEVQNLSDTVERLTRRIMQLK